MWSHSEYWETYYAPKANTPAWGGDEWPHGWHMVAADSLEINLAHVLSQLISLGEVMQT